MVVISLKGKLKAGLLIFSILVVCAAAYHFIPPGSSWISAVTGQTSLKPVYSVDTDEKKVAISFDACWGAERTEAILDILDDHKVKATFFLVNIWLEDYPDKAKEIAARGHEIGLHSTTHPHFTQLSVGEMEKELTENRKMIKEVTGIDAKLFRPPFGDYSNTVIDTVNNMGLTAVQWSVDSLDWKEDMTAQKIAERVLDKVQAGSIILMHNDGKYTPQAIKIIIPELQRQGFSVGPVSDLLIKGDWYVDVNGIQRKKAGSQ